MNSHIFVHSIRFHLIPVVGSLSEAGDTVRVHYLEAKPSGDKDTTQTTWVTWAHTTQLT